MVYAVLTHPTRLSPGLGLPTAVVRSAAFGDVRQRWTLGTGYQRFWSAEFGINANLSGNYL